MNSSELAGLSMGRRQLVLAMLSMLSLYFFSFFLRTAVPGTIFNELQADFRLSAAAVTGLGSGFLYIYAGMQLVVGLAADRFGGTRTLLVGGFIMAVGAAWFPACQSPTALYASRAFTGFGASFMYLCIIKELDLLFGHRRFPVMLGVSLFIGYSGGIFAMLPFERIVAAFGWRQSLAGVAVGIFIAWGSACWALRGLDHFTPPKTRFSLRPLWRVIQNRSSWALLLVSLINYPSYFVMQAAIGKKFLQDYAGLTSAHSATFTTIMMFISAALMLMAGPLLKLTGQRRKPHLYAAGVLLLAANLMLLAGVLTNASSWWFLAAYGLLAASTASAPAGNATMKELNEANAVGAAIAVYNGLAYVGVAILVNASGLILDAFRQEAVVTADAIQYPPAAYATFFGALVALSLISLALLVWVPEGTRQTSEQTG
ncbi:MAG: MFS transporter [Pirellulales bacterium]